MDSAQVRSIAVLAAVLLALTGALVFWEPAPSAGEPDATARVVEPTDPTRAVAATIAQASGERQDTIVLEKEDGIWRVREPFQADADVERVIGVLDAVRESERGLPVEGSPEAFGLAPPQVVVDVTMDDGSNRRLALGNVAAVGWRTYALAADGTVAAVRGKPGEELLRRPGEYRDHRIFRFRPEEVRRVMVESANGRLEATKSDAGWFLTGFGRVDLVELDAWITDLLTLRVELFLDLEHETVADPRYLVEVETADGVQSMRVGRDTPYGPLAFWGDGLDGVIDPPLLRMLDRGPTDVGVSDAFPFDPVDTVAIVMSGAVERRIERGPDGWGEDPVAGAVRHAQLVYRATPPAWGAVELTVVLEGERTRTVEIGPVDADGFRPVRDTGGGAAMRVPADELEPLFAVR